MNNLTDIDDDYIIKRKLKQDNEIELMKKLKRIFETEKMVREHSIGTPSVLIWFTYKEIDQILNETLEKIKFRKI